MPRPTRAIVDLDKLHRNYRRAAALADPGKAIAVVKANGYGHGIETVATSLASVAPRFAVAILEEALALRAAVPRTPVLVMQGVYEPDEWLACSQKNFIPALHSPEQLDSLRATRLRGPVTVWIKVNTGMNRLGFPSGDVPRVLSALEAIPGVSVEALMTHFAQADEPDHPRTGDQLRVMADLRSAFPAKSQSVANSAAHYTTRAGENEWTRPGIMLYGSAPLVRSTGAMLGLEAVMTLESALVAVRDLQPGDAVGYGADWCADRPTRMGIVAVGYGDGYPRAALSGTPVAVAGRRTRLIGRVSMDMLAVDLGELPDAKPGDPVELWGSTVSVDEVAQAAGTIGYELLTRVTSRVPRVLVSASA